MVKQSDLIKKFEKRQAENEFERKWSEVLRLAFEVAKHETRRCQKLNKDHHSYTKGFVYVKVNGTNNDLFRYCMKHERQFLTTGWKGLVFSNPAKFQGRNPIIYDAGGRAFAEVLGRYGIETEVVSRSV